MAGPSRWFCNEAAKSMGWCVGCSSVVSQHGYWLLTVGRVLGWANLLYSMNWYWMSMKRKLWNVNAALAGTVTLLIICPNTTDRRPGKAAAAPQCTPLCIYTFLKARTPALLSQGQRSLNVWRAMVLRNTVSGFRAGLPEFRVYSAQIGFGSWFSNISCHCNRRKRQHSYRLQKIRTQHFLIIKAYS